MDQRLADIGLSEFSRKTSYKVEKAKQTVTPEKNMPSIRISSKVAVAYCCLNAG